MFKEFYNKVLVPFTQLTNSELHQFLWITLVWVVVISIIIFLFYLLIMESKKIVKGIIISLFSSVFLYFNVFWGLCFLDNTWKQCFWLMPATLFGMICAGAKIYKKKKRGNKHEK